MRKTTIIILLTLFSGCADPYGNFIPFVNFDQQELAGEAVKQLAVLYPPAKTQLEIKQIPSDAFGMALVNTLRKEGYALMEFNAEEVKSQTFKASPSPALPLHYILDQADNSNLVFITLLVGPQSITRPYRVQNDSLTPAGDWVRKE
jgi:type IV secretion system protein TrbH